MIQQIASMCAILKNSLLLSNREPALSPPTKNRDLFTPSTLPYRLFLKQSFLFFLWEVDSLAMPCNCTIRYT